MSTATPGQPDPLRDDREVQDLDESHLGPTSPGPDSTDAGAATAGTGIGGVNQPDTGPGPAAGDVDGPDRV